MIFFTKMHGAGNDFVVLDETKGLLNLTTAHYRFLADRHFGIGADQILSVRAAPNAEVDFEYIIHNADGSEVEQCGNGARCFARYVFDQGLTSKKRFRVQTQKSVIEPVLTDDGRVTVNMGVPVFDLAAIPFDATHLKAVSPTSSWEKWRIDLENVDNQRDSAIDFDKNQANQANQTHHVDLAVLSMGNPHAVCVVNDVDLANVQTLGAYLEKHPRFAKRVNVGFMQIVSKEKIRLRVFERGAGETLACGTGACAAVVAGIRLGDLSARVDVQTKGGVLTIEWAGMGKPVYLTGDATTVFKGQFEFPSLKMLAQFAV